jgi:hypothetical protein
MHSQQHTPLGKVCAAPAFSDDHPDVLTYITRAQKILPAFITYGYILMTRHNEERDESSLSAARSSGSTHISAAVLLFMPVWVAGGWSGGWVGWKRRKSARMSSWPSAHHWLQTLYCTFLPFLPPHACVCVSREREREIASVLEAPMVLKSCSPENEKPFQQHKIICCILKTIYQFRLFLCICLHFLFLLI